MTTRASSTGDFGALSHQATKSAATRARWSTGTIRATSTAKPGCATGARSPPDRRAIRSLHSCPMTALDAFHPTIRRWFATLGEPSAPQQFGWPKIRDGGHVLIAAPTGSGKTLAAFLVAIDSLLAQGEA